MKRDKTDALWSRFIKLRAGGYCQRCKKYLGVKSRGLHAMHCFSRGRKSTRWDTKNGASGCYGCHRYLDTHPMEKAEFFLELLGQAEYTALAVRAETPCKPDIPAIEKDLKAKIKLLEA